MSNKNKESDSENIRIMIMHAVHPMLDACGNSYANAYTEKWLTEAKKLGAYHGPVIGKISDLKEEWEWWLENNGGLLDLKTS